MAEPAGARTRVTWAGGVDGPSRRGRAEYDERLPAGAPALSARWLEYDELTRTRNWCAGGHVIGYLVGENEPARGYVHVVEDFRDDCSPVS